jgi:hypothetical protein
MFLRIAVLTLFTASFASAGTTVKTGARAQALAEALSKAGGRTVKLTGEEKHVMAVRARCESAPYSCTVLVPSRVGPPRRPRILTKRSTGVRAQALAEALQDVGVKDGESVRVDCDFKPGRARCEIED